MLQLGGLPVHVDVTRPCVPLAHVALQTPPAAVALHVQVALGRGAGWPEQVAAGTRQRPQWGVSRNPKATQRICMRYNHILSPAF